jgi:hypothetical protein
MDQPELMKQKVVDGTVRPELQQISQGLRVPACLHRANPRSSGTTSNRSTGSLPFDENTDTITEAAWTSMPTQKNLSWPASSRMWLRVKLQPTLGFHLVKT